jgi:hypothetical protein
MISNRDRRFQLCAHRVQLGDHCGVDGIALCGTV